MTEHQWPAQRPPHELGVVAYGPLILAQAPGITAGLRCVYAHPSGLHLPLALRASGERILYATAWSPGKLRRYTPGSFAERENSQHGYTPYSEPQLIVEINGTPGMATTTGALHASDDDQIWARDAAYWIDDLPRDGLLRITLSWPQAGLPETSHELVLTGLDDLAAQVLPLV